MGLLDDITVFAHLRGILGMSCGWTGIWLTSLGTLRVSELRGSLFAVLT
jgi:hypothetical protein